ncbi:Na+/H+ antiporter NhaA [Nocardioides terrigena]|uniref:Na+/H+ antiporter NhaA n=1 Tax=Nocardioides terrigena TaxID=424797 RepID=UPI000D30B356|nr:Na+/H+ antiporter NhaA [Nocardioides terrigena]
MTPHTHATPAPSTRLARLGEWSRLELSGGILLAAATVLALVAANSPAVDLYTAVRDAAFGPEALHLHLTVGEWAADGLLAIFFFVVGLELKREFVAGDLSDPRRALVPITAAVGGVVVPVLVYLAVVSALGGGAAELAGWAVPAATDIAFAVAVLALVSTHLPAALRTFLLTLAVVDDLIAITIIAVGFTDGLDLMTLGLSLVAIVAFAVVVRRRPVWWLLVPLALVAWTLVHASGIHATIAGVLLGLSVPVIDQGVRAESAAEREEAAAHGPAARLEHLLKPWSSCLAVPVFAFFAAGVTVGGLGGLAESVSTPVALGTIAGLVLGKAVGITGAAWLVTRVPGVRLDDDLRWPDLLGAALLGGIGFTVSLLVGELAFGTGSGFDDDVKVGVLVGSLVASVLALVVLAARNRHYRGLPHVHEEAVGAVGH